MRENPFSPKVLLTLGAIGLVSLLVATGYLIFGGTPAGEPSAQNDTFSRSAVGHHALLQMLKKLNVPVMVSHFDSGKRASHATLLLLEPDRLESVDIDAMAKMAPHTLLVLPKWSGEPDPMHPDRVEVVRHKNLSEIEDVLHKFAPDASVVFGAASEKWLGTDEQSPTLTDPQLVGSSLEIDPIISTSSGTLLGKISRDEGEVWILSDPDLLNNYGLKRGDNAAIVVSMLDRIRNDQPLVIDEASHGYRVEPSIWRELLSFPLVVVTIQLLLLGLALLWAALYRFGRPLDQGTGLQAGGQLLIENSAALLLSGGHAAHTVDHYLDQAEAAVGRRLRVPPSMNRAQQLSWLENIGESRNVSKSLREVRQRLAAVVNSEKPSARDLVEVAEQIHQWKEEMIYGRSNSGPRGSGSAPPDSQDRRR